MKIQRIIKKAAALSLVLGTLTSPVAAQSDVTAEAVVKVKQTALSYAENENFTYAKKYLDEYAAGAKALAESGVWHRAVADMAQVMADAYAYEPTLAVTAEGDKLFTGSDGYNLAGATAVRLNVPYGTANVEDYLGLIPKTDKELCILVCFEMQDERSMISLRRGNDDLRLERNLRQLSRIEGSVYLSFCPAVDTMKNTRTLHYNFIEAYRYVAAAARRIAPNVSLVYTVSDMPVAGEDTVSKFYPGDEYVDVLGVEVLSSYYTDPFITTEELFWNKRGEFYDPVRSVKFIEDSFRKAAGRDVPLMVTGVAFPKSGKYARASWESDMRRFFDLLPKFCPDLTAVFWSSKSSAYGNCNLRENPDVAAAFAECSARSAVRAVPFEDGVTVTTANELSVLLDGVFCGGESEVYLDGKTDTAFTEGEHLLQVFVTEDSFYSKAEYACTVSPEGGVSLTLIAPAIDYNGNGIMDHGDVEILTAVIAKWQVDAGGYPTDVNGDGKTNIHDVVALGNMIAP